MNQIFELRMVDGFLTAGAVRGNRVILYASQDLSLKLPLLPQIDIGLHKDSYDVYDSFLKEGNGKNQYNFNKDEASIHSDGFVWGYTEAASSKRYTEEEVINLLKHIREYDDFYELVDGNLLGKFVPSYTKEYLNPKQPIKVEIEMGTSNGDQYNYKDGELILFPKVNEKGFVNVLRWIYD